MASSHLEVGNNFSVYHIALRNKLLETNAIGFPEDMATTGGCSACWKLRGGCQRCLQYDWKLFFHTTPTNQDLRQKLSIFWSGGLKWVFFPTWLSLSLILPRPWPGPMATAILRGPDLLYIICGNGYFSQAVTDSNVIPTETGAACLKMLKKKIQ